MTNCNFIFSQELGIEVITSLTSLVHMELDIFWISINLDFVTETYIKLLDLFHQVTKSLYSDRRTWTFEELQLISSHWCRDQDFEKECNPTPFLCITMATVIYDVESSYWSKTGRDTCTETNPNWLLSPSPGEGLVPFSVCVNMQYRYSRCAHPSCK